MRTRTIHLNQFNLQIKRTHLWFCSDSTMFPFSLSLFLLAYKPASFRTECRQSHGQHCTMCMVHRAWCLGPTVFSTLKCIYFAWQSFYWSACCSVLFITEIAIFGVGAMQIICIVIGASASAMDIFVTGLYINAVLTMLWMPLCLSLLLNCWQKRYQWIVCRIVNEPNANEAQETLVIVRRVEWP